MIEQLPDRDAPSAVIPRWQIACRRLIEIDLPPFDQLQHRRRGELLADGADVHHGCGSQPLARREV